MKIREKCERVTVKAGENLKKLKEKGYLRPTKHSILLPYFDELEARADENLQEILNGLYICFATDNCIECLDYSEHFCRYLNNFGLRLQKETFFHLVRFFYEALCREHQRVELLKCAASCLSKILTLAEPLFFGWKDLTLDWRQFFGIFRKCQRGKVYPDNFSILTSVASQIAIFYDPKEHAAIWEACLEDYNIGSQTSMLQFLTLCWNFLSIQGMSAEEIQQYAAKTWIERFWNLYLDAEMNTVWQIICIDTFADVAMLAPQTMDFGRMYDTLYMKLMRGFLLTVRNGKTGVGDGTDNHTVIHLAKMCAYTIGGPQSSISHFKRLIQCVHVNVHPTNSGSHDSTINEFVHTFLVIFHNRIYRERLATNKRRVPREYYLTDADIDEVTKALIDVTIMMMYSMNFSSDFKIIHLLNAMNREIVGPKLLDHFYSSISAVNEPQRFTITIEAFTTVIFDLIRSPVPDYRAPRGIIYDSHWIKKMEEERKQFPTYKENSALDPATVDKHEFVSVRPHAFYIMEILVNQINVNDVQRTSVVLKTLASLFSSFPLMNYQEYVKQPEISQDDKLICILSARVPHFVRFALEKMLDVISCLAVGQTRSSSTSAGASMSSESQQDVGDEESTLKETIQRCAAVIFSRVSGTVKDELYAYLFNFLKQVEFATYMATDLLSTLVASAVWRCPGFYDKVAQLFIARLKELLTEDVRKQKSATSTLIYNATMARALYMVPHEIVLKHEKVLCELTDLLLSSQCKLINRVGTQGINTILSTVLDVTVEETESSQERSLLELHALCPNTVWAPCTALDKTVIKWYIPAKPEVDFAQRIAHRFLFRIIEEVQPGKLDRDQLRQKVYHISTLIAGLDTFSHPATASFVSDIYSSFHLPITKYDLGTACNVEFELRGPDGQNTRELLVAMVERMIPATQDPTALTSLASIAFWCLDRPTGSSNASDLEGSLSSRLRILKDSTFVGVRQASQYTWDELAALKHSAVVYYHKSQFRQPNTFDERIIKCLVELAMNDYAQVRENARRCLSSNMDQIYRCRNMVLPQICAVLMDATLKNTDRITGALELMKELDLLISTNPKIQHVVWNAMLNMKVHDNFVIRNLFDQIPSYVKLILKTPVILLGTPETHELRNAKVIGTGVKFFNDSIGIWKKLLTEMPHITLRLQDFEAQRHSQRTELVEMLFAQHIMNRNHHHTRQKLAHTMVYNVQRETADKRTMLSLLSQMISEEEEVRSEAREWLAYWMKKNKPKTVRTEIPAPDVVKTGIMENGIRKDNLWIAYDSENLPNTEQKWNEMIFVEKEQGSCRWPRHISAVRKRADGAPLTAEPRTAADEVIIRFFCNEDSVRRFFDLRTVDKDSQPTCDCDVYNVVKYVIRNYPEFTKPLLLFQTNLMRMIESRDRLEQMAAAELFIGIVRGIKHHPFSFLEHFWKQMIPQLDKFFNIMTDDAMGPWETAISKVLSVNTDLRRNWWLVEALMDGAQRTAEETEQVDCRQTFRFMHLIFKKWRYGEIMKRMCSVSWEKLQLAANDDSRSIHAYIFRTASVIREMNNSSSLLDDVPNNFIPKTFDEMLNVFIDQVPQLNSDSMPRSPEQPVSLKRRRRSSGSKGTPAKRAKRTSDGNSLDRDPTPEQKKAMVFFRTLLEFILQFYDNSTRSYTPALVKMLPKLLEYANEADYDQSEELVRDVDITRDSAIIVHEYMSGAWINETFINDVMKSWSIAYENKKNTQRVRIAAIKFLHSAVFSNIFNMNRESRLQNVQKLLLTAVMDQEIEVRREASKCLLFLIHCGYLQLSDTQVDYFAEVAEKSKAKPEMHGAVLILSAIALAFPFSLPVDQILKPLRVLSACKFRNLVVFRTVTDTLLEFRIQHRDDWKKTELALGESLAFEIMNATAPYYYA